VILAFAAIGLALGYRESGWDGAWARFLNYHLPVAFFLYLPWALLQQFLFQFYLLGRLLTLFPAPLSVVATGMAYSFVHLPDIGVTLAAAVAGIFWTFLYRRLRSGSFHGLERDVTVIFFSSMVVSPKISGLSVIQERS
jgi:hypothetical protein